MKYGFDDDKFYIEVNGCSREVKNLKEEVEAEARRIYAVDKKLLVSLSAGLDSQVVLHSFLSQGINIDSVFFYMPGFNDNEYFNVKEIQRKTGAKVIVVDADPLKIRKEVDQLSVDLDVNPAHAVHAYFAKQLPEDVNLIQGLEQPNFFARDNKYYLLYSYFDPDISRQRAVETSRKSYKFTFRDEVLLSYLTDPFFISMLRSWPYIESNGLQRKGTKMRAMWATENYVKPMQYAYYWKDSLQYFPKYAGSEKTTFWHRLYVKDRIVLVPLRECTTLLKSPASVTKRFYQLEGPQHHIEYFN